MKAVRSEYPRPEFVRSEWLSLNGEWDFHFAGEQDWSRILVPFVYQCEASGIGLNRMCDYVYYRREIHVPQAWKDRRIRLNFGAVDYECKVRVNGQCVGGHVGGNVGFCLDITDYLNWEKDILEVDVYDPLHDETIPRGKQYWREQPEYIWYTPSTGIWQSVWIEPVSKVHLEKVFFTPDVDQGMVTVEYELSDERTLPVKAETVDGGSLRIQVQMKEEVISDLQINAPALEGMVSLDLFQNHILRGASHKADTWCWTPENPNLFDVTLTLEKDGQVCDTVNTYFGMRKIEAKDGMVWLNNRPCIQKLVLDQGYWEESLMTAPGDEDFVRDITLAKEMGFNGCRKHQKTEDPRFLYWADKLGFLVWEEVGASVSFTRNSVKRFLDEWDEAVKRDYNHPGIVTWVVINESWGIPDVRTDQRQQAHAQALYYHVKSLDATRLVISNDGWEITKSDICAIHNYHHGTKEDLAKQEQFRQALSTRENLVKAVPAGKPIYADGYQHEGEPILLTEFGGVAFASDRDRDWGYTSVKNEEEYLEVYGRMIDMITSSEALFGYCYTQLTDVQQEINGLLTKDRRPKVALEKIRAINERMRNYLVR